MFVLRHRLPPNCAAPMPSARQIECCGRLPVKRGRGSSHTPGGGSHGVTGDSAARLDVGKLESRAAFFFVQGLASSSQKTYKSGENRYLRFCQLGGVTPLPVNESSLCKFVSYLADEKLKHCTIKTYLSGVRFQIRSGLLDLFHGSHMPRLEYIMKGVKRVEAQSGGKPRLRLPITPPLLRLMKGVWSASAASHDTKLIWVACCLGFFWFLQAGEMTTPDNGSYDPSVHLGFGDVAVDNPRCPSFLRVTIKQSKTDPFCKGVDIFVGRTGTDICPVAGILSYLACRGSGPGPLFVFSSGRFLTRKRFVELVRVALSSAGVDQEKYCGHSFRIGAATTAAAKGVEDNIIKTLGRWESVAYLQYVRIPRNQLMSYSSLLGAPA